MPTYTATHTEARYTVVEIEIEADSQEEADEINCEWNIDEGDTAAVKIIDRSEKGTDYDSSEVQRKT